MRLQRIDYLQVGPLKSSASIQVLSGRSSKFQQRFVVGDQRGLLQVVAVKKSQPHADFQIGLKGPINSITLAIHSAISAEMIVAATGQTLYAFNGKGNAIFTLETNLVEPIQHLSITDNEDIIVANSYVYNHYRDGKEVNYYLSADKINALTVLPSKKVPSLTPLLACQDSTIYSLRNSSIRHQLLLESIPTVIQLYRNGGGSSGEWIVFGTSCGRIGLVCCSRAGPSLQWILPPSNKSGAAITCLDFYDINDVGTGAQLLVGRDDGTVQVYEFANDTAVEDSRDHRAPPTCIYSQNYNDSIASVRGGVIGVNGFTEILVATHHGWIFGLTTDLSASGQTREQLIGASEAMAASANERREKIQALKAQVLQLEAKISETQGKYSSTDSSQPEEMMKQLDVSAKMVYSPDDNVYHILLESQVSIDYCLVYCDANVQMVDVETNLAILSLTPSENGHLLATYRCQTNTKRLDMKIRSQERSTSHQICLYVAPNINPRCAIKKTFNLPCLCLHLRCHRFSWNDQPYSQLIFKGAFTLADVHSWIHSCLPNVSEKVPPEDEVTFYFIHSRWKTQLTCHYKKGEATFRSENILALSLVREFISKRATAKNMHLNIVTDAVPEATDRLLQRIHPELLQEMQHQQQIKLARVLSETMTDQIAQNSNDEWMSPEFKKILDIGKESLTSLTTEKIDDYLDFLTNLFNSHRAFEGATNNSQPQLLKDQLSSCTTDQLLDLFRSTDRAMIEAADATDREVAFRF